MILCGIEKLDEHLYGGIEEHKSVLISAVPGMNSRVFAYHIVQANPKMKIGYVIENAFPSQVQKDTSKYLFSEAPFKKVVYVDAFSTGLGLPSKEKYFAKDATNIDSILEAIEQAVDDENIDVLIIDSLSGVLGKNPSKVNKVVSVLNELKQKCTVVCLYTSWNAEEHKKVEASFDYAIELKSIEERLLSRSYFKVVKSPSNFNSTAVSFRIGFDGVAVYVPKIIITGPFHAGKTTFIHTVSTKAVSVNRMGTTIALDHGYIEHSGFSVDLFGTPGQERFEFMLDILNKDAFGVLLIVDSTKPETFDRAKQMLAHVSRYSLPYIIAANKQDLPSALKPAKVKQLMGVDVKVMGTVATTGKGCMEALKALIDMIVEQK